MIDLIPLLGNTTQSGKDITTNCGNLFMTKFYIEHLYYIFQKDSPMKFVLFATGFYYQGLLLFELMVNFADQFLQYIFKRYVLPAKP